MQVSIWEKESFYADRDVIIIGGGLAGLWTAHELKQQKTDLKILIIERGIIPTGASTRNAGFACFGSATELLHDAKVMGESRMLQIVEMRYKGIEKIRKTFDDAVTGFDACGGYECLSRTLHDVDEIDEHLLWLNDNLSEITGDTQTFTWSNERLHEFGFEGFDAMIENKFEAGLHSGKLVQALTRKVQSEGVDILTGLQVENWSEEEQKIIVHTKPGISITAKQLIVCPNAFSSQLTSQLNTQPARGQIIVTSPIEGLKMKGTFHYDEGFYYFRNVDNRILLGGARNKAFESEATTELSTSDVIQNELQRFIATHLLPDKTFTIDYRWSGIMGFTNDKQPVTKKLSDRVTAMVACNGMGVALTPVMAEKMVKEFF
ncbi:MAG: NAD(P)/FAD-dependent oxidoreductase [Ilyomonas sp.]